MWPKYQKDNWEDVNLYQEPTSTGRRLDVGGFILADSFETFLKNVSEHYLELVWKRLAQIFETHQIDTPDLSWGYFHPGETFFEGVRTHSPLDYIGFSSASLVNFEENNQFVEIDNKLKDGFPSLRFVSTWRAIKWKIEPDKYQLALRLIEAMCFDESSNWEPKYVVKTGEKGTVWYSLAVALTGNDSERIRNLLNEAERIYSPLGYKILTQGYSRFVEVK